MMANDNINRRDFLKIVGITTAAVGASMAGCTPKNNAGTASTAELGETKAEDMTFRINNKKGDKVSLLGYGMMRLPIIKNEEDMSKSTIDQEEVNRLVDYAMAHGVNYYDTSPVYVMGWSEASTGLALRRYPRESYYIATKLSNFQNCSRENSIEMYRKSFSEMQIDYIDYYLLHSIGNGGIEKFRERYVDNGMIEFLMAEREAGRIRNLGFSFHGTKEVFDEVLAMDDYVHWDFVQIQLNYVDWTHATRNNVNADYLYAELQKRDIQAVIMEPLLGGRLSKVPEHILTRLKSRDLDKSVASWAFRFAGSPRGVLTVLSGMTFMEHLQENLQTYSPLHELTEEDLVFLEETAQIMMSYPTIPCNDCKYCMPCPYGIDIPAVLLHYNKCVNEGNIATTSQSESYRKARQAFLVGYDRSVPRLRQASHCIGCGQCLSHCPQSIDIPKELHRIDDYVEDLKQNRL